MMSPVKLTSPSSSSSISKIQEPGFTDGEQNEALEVDHAAVHKIFAGQTPFTRNPGIELDMAWVNATQVNKPAVIKRAADHVLRRTVKKQAQLGWLLRIVTLIDLTTLSGDDTETNVARLCAKARQPIRQDFISLLKLTDKQITTGAVCVYPNRVEDAKQALKGSGIPIASVAAGFPAGQTPLQQRLEEIKVAVASGAMEIDIVLNRQLVIKGDWVGVYKEVKLMREACGDAHLKTILATGELPTFRDIYKASLVCMMAGADFIKTSTGKEKINATLPVGLVMIRAIRDYYEQTGYMVGFKPAGGISNAKDAISWLSLMLEELGPRWTFPDLFRIGASSLLTDVERQLEHGLTGHYSGKHYLAMA
jgi:deoxyribose-phosphate aldolase